MTHDWSIAGRVVSIDLQKIDWPFFQTTADSAGHDSLEFDLLLEYHENIWTCFIQWKFKRSWRFEPLANSNSYSIWPPIGSPLLPPPTNHTDYRAWFLTWNTPSLPRKVGHTSSLSNYSVRIIHPETSSLTKMKQERIGQTTCGAH